MDLYPRAKRHARGPRRAHPAVYAQVQWGAGLSGYDTIHFVVWAPAGTRTTLPFAGASAGEHLGGTQETRVLHDRRTETAPGHAVRETLVSTPHGFIQVTELPRDPAWFKWALPQVRRFWAERYVPAFLACEGHVVA